VAVCLLDEMDFLKTKDENVIYNFIEWSLHYQSNILIIGISNTSEFPETLSSRYVNSSSILNPTWCDYILHNHRVQSRMGRLERIVFSAYDFTQVQAILVDRLSDLGSLLFDPKDPRMIEYVARKAVSGALGDLRSALKICKR
jgi:Cdc6-like AAA superfamily ATPase